VGLEKALRRVETREGGWVGGRKPLCLMFRRDGGFVVVLEGCGGWEVVLESPVRSGYLPFSALTVTETG